MDKPIGYDELLLASDSSICVKTEYFKNDGDQEEKIAYRIENLKKVDQNKLKPYEITVLDEVNNFFKNMGSRSISDYMHNEIAYKKTKNGEIISYGFALKIRNFDLESDG